MESAYFQLYAIERWCGTANTNQVRAASLDHKGRFGDIVIGDWPLLDGKGSDANVVGRVQGQQTRTEWDTDSWEFNFIIKFEDCKFKGSTIVTRGIWYSNDSPFEWAILGGTGRFSLAQGIIHGNSTGLHDGTMYELNICVFYRPIEKPTVAIRLD